MKVTTEIFIERAKNRHGNKFDYGQTVYINNKTKIKFICPIHGLQETLPNNHLKTKTGCGGCGSELTANAFKHDVKIFVEKAKKIHKDKYDYSLVDYVNRHTKIKILCKKHGMFKQTPNSHLQGNGCKSCATELLVNTRKGVLKYNEQDILKLSKKIWGKNRWDYSNFKFTGIINRSRLKCNICGDIINPTVAMHLQRITSCSCKVQRKGWKKSDWIKLCELQGYDYPYLYIIHLFDSKENFIKIGFTSNIEERFKQFPYDIKLINKVIGKPSNVFDLEKKLHKIFKKHKYKPLQKFGGYTECFSSEILQDFNFQIFLR